MDTTAIIKQLTAERDRIDAAIKLLSGSPATAATVKKRERRKMSAAARKRIAEAQRKRWAAQKAGKTTPVKAAKQAAAPAKKRGKSAAARRRIAAAQKKRWAAIKAAKKVAKKVPAKKASKKAPAKKVAPTKKAAPKKAPAKAMKAVPEKAAAASTEAALAFKHGYGDIWTVHFIKDECRSHVGSRTCYYHFPILEDLRSFVTRCQPEDTTLEGFEQSVRPGSSNLPKLRLCRSLGSRPRRFAPQTM
jgi:hypothetical protein